MNKRTIYLLAGAGIIGLFYFGDLGYQAYVEEPIKKLNKKAKSIRKSGDKAQSQLDRHPSVLKALESYEKMSLPYTADVTRTAYQGRKDLEPRRNAPSRSFAFYQLLYLLVTHRIVEYRTTSIKNTY